MTSINIDLDEEGVEKLLASLIGNVKVVVKQELEELLTINKFAELTGWSVGTIRNMCSKGTIPHRKHGSKIVFFRKELGRVFESVTTTDDIISKIETASFLRKVNSL